MLDYLATLLFVSKRLCVISKTMDTPQPPTLISFKAPQNYYY